ncbi:MAG: hypothetical protein U5N85_11460 [Arcicella sp.]|nr:hypothetical protein [Arcicella sp.]
MKKQIFTIILFTVISLNVWGQFRLDGGTNSLRLQTGGVDRLFVSPANGNIGVATVSPNAKLDVNGDLALTKKVTVTTSTQNALDRQGASRIYISGTVTLNGIAGGEDGMIVFIYTSASGDLTINNSSILAASGDRITTHTGTTVTINARGGVSMIYDALLSTWRVFGFADENSTWNSKGNGGTSPTTNFIGTTDNQALAFKTNNVETMRILSNGKVGIGTNAPERKFHVFDGNSGLTPNTNTSLFVERNVNNYVEIASPDNAERGVVFSNPTNGSGGGIYYLNKNMNFRTNTNDVRMTILANGNVGIGTTAPTAKLDIEGDIVVRKTTVTTVGVINGLNRNGGSSVYFNTVGPVTLNGIAGGQDGMILYLFTALNVTLNINNENINATAANRIATNTGSTLTISGRGGATLIYDSATSLWRVIGIAN